MAEGLLSIQITRNDTGKLLSATKDIRDNLHLALNEIGKMWIRNAQLAMDRQGPGWKRHAQSTIDKYGSYKLLHSRPGKVKGGKHHLNKIKLHYDYEVKKVGRSAELNIVPKSSFAAEMLFIHNRPKGDYTINNIPGRPYFQWRTGHFKESEENQSRAILTRYVSESLKKRGIFGKTIGFTESQAMYSWYDWGGLE